MARDCRVFRSFRRKLGLTSHANRESTKYVFACARSSQEMQQASVVWHRLTALPVHPDCCIGSNLPMLPTLAFQPAAFCSANLGCGYGTDHAQDIKFAKGTTTLAFKVNSGQLVVPQIFLCHLFALPLSSALMIQQKCVQCMPCNSCAAYPPAAFSLMESAS